jgi:hypothetical protein
MAKNVHPLIDILKYGSSSYPGDIEKLLKGIAELPGYQTASERIGKILWDDWPSLPGVNPDFDKVRRLLLEVERDLKGGASATSEKN